MNQDREWHWRNATGCSTPEDANRLLLAQAQHISELEKSLENARKERDALAAFKSYVHQRLDEAGVPTHPDGPHSEAGCRIGDRLDIALARLKPSGQAAGDVALVEAGLTDAPHWLLAKPALARLATKAQGYEAAVADNAALVEVAKDAAAGGCEEIDGPCNECLACIAAHAAAKPHPGAALLAEHQREVEALKAANAALEKDLRVLVDMPQEQWEALRTACMESHLRRTTGVGGSAICACGAGNGGSAACRPLRSLSQVRELSVLHEPRPISGAALLQQGREILEPLQAVATGLAEEMEAAIREKERTRGGMSVPFHGDFASAPPSMLGRLRWWAMELRAALGGNTSVLLVRARNEGLEALAMKLLERRDQMHGRNNEQGRRRGLEEAAAIARAMKEHEQ